MYDGTPDDEMFFVDAMTGHEFEYFCADLLGKIGFCDIYVTKGSGDQGVDIIAEFEGCKYAIQCKNYSGKISNKAVQEVSAGRMFYGCDAAIVMTNSYFTTGAIELAEAVGVWLCDRNVLYDMLQNGIKATRYYRR